MPGRVAAFADPEDVDAVGIGVNVFACVSEQPIDVSRHEPRLVHRRSLGPLRTKQHGLARRLVEHLHGLSEYQQAGVLVLRHANNDGIAPSWIVPRRKLIRTDHRRFRVRGCHKVPGIAGWKIPKLYLLQRIGY